MSGEFTYQPKWDPKTVLTTTAISALGSRIWAVANQFPGLSDSRPRAQGPACEICEMNIGLAVDEHHCALAQ